MRSTALIVLALAAAFSSGAVEWSGNVAAELRLFPNSPLDDIQHGHNLSLSFQPELYHEFEDESSVLFVPFLRLDQHDSERTHADIRELFWRKSWDNWDLRIGLGYVFC